MADDDRLILATSGDTRYAMPLAAMLRSVSAHLQPQSRVEVYILSDEMAARERKKVEVSVPATMQLHWVKPDLGLLKDAPVHGHVTIATYFRIIAPSVLPAEAARAIYLDADVIVEADLAELGNAPMDGNVVMAVQENDWQLASPYALSFCKELGLNETLPYLNGGVLVYDLNSWRKGGYTASALSIIKRFEKQLRWWDQDALNAVLAGKWKALDRMWNFRVDCAVTDRREPGGLNGGNSKPKIVHYAGNVKPWHFSSYAANPETRFFKYLDQTAWKGWRPRRQWLRKTGRQMLNKHFYGSILRRIPIVGPIWRSMRSRTNKL